MDDVGVDGKPGIRLFLTPFGVEGLFDELLGGNGVEFVVFGEDDLLGTQAGPDVDVDDGDGGVGLE